jgi:hypothetical protein
MINIVDNNNHNHRNHHNDNGNDNDYDDDDVLACYFFLMTLYTLL